MLCIMPIFVLIAFLTIPLLIYTSTNYGGEQGYIMFKSNVMGNLTESASRVFDNLHNSVINNNWQPYALITLPIIIIWIIWLFNKAKEIIKENKTGNKTEKKRR